jgi:hypothetical protein
MKNHPDTEAAPEAAHAASIYEVTCHSIEIGNLICYRTHRLPLTKEQADTLNKNQPESVRFIGI